MEVWQSADWGRQNSPLVSLIFFSNGQYIDKQNINSLGDILSFQYLLGSIDCLSPGMVSRLSNSSWNSESLQTGEGKIPIQCRFVLSNGHYINKQNDNWFDKLQALKYLVDSINSLGPSSCECGIQSPGSISHGLIYIRSLTSDFRLKIILKYVTLYLNAGMKLFIECYQEMNCYLISKKKVYL